MKAKAYIVIRRKNPQSGIRVIGNWDEYRVVKPEEVKTDVSNTKTVKAGKVEAAGSLVQAAVVSSQC